MTQPGFNQQQYQQTAYPTVQQNNSAQYLQGQKYKEKSLIFGIVGFFFFGIIFGPLAIMNASKAEALNHSATFGKVLGWIDTILSSIWLIIVIIFAISAITSSSR